MEYNDYQIQFSDYGCIIRDSKGKYIGQVVKVISPITNTSGAITIYGERWEARCEGDDVIPEGVNVKILRNESLIMFVEKV